jgi:hypothetical protein
VYKDLKSQGIAQRYGDESNLLGKVAQHFGVPVEELRVVDREGHWRIFSASEPKDAC